MAAQFSANPMTVGGQPGSIATALNNGVGNKVSLDCGDGHVVIGVLKDVSFHATQQHLEVDLKMYGVSASLQNTNTSGGWTVCESQDQLNPDKKNLLSLVAEAREISKIAAESGNYNLAVILESMIGVIESFSAMRKYGSPKGLKAVADGFAEKLAQQDMMRRMLDHYKSGASFGKAVLHEADPVYLPHSRQFSFDQVSDIASAIGIPADVLSANPGSQS